MTERPALCEGSDRLAVIGSFVLLADGRGGGRCPVCDQDVPVAEYGGWLLADHPVPA